MTPDPFHPHADDLAGRLYAARTVMLSGPLTPQTVATVTAQLTTLAATSPDPITLYVSAYGGTADAAGAADALYDVVRFIGCRVRVVATGGVAGPVALVYVAAPRADRYSLPGARFQLHQPDPRPSGPARDVVRIAEETAARRVRLQHLFAEATGQPPERIAEVMREPAWMSAEDACTFGLVGQVVHSIRELT